MPIIKFETASKKYHLVLFRELVIIRMFGYIAAIGLILLFSAFLFPACYIDIHATNPSSRTIITPSVSIAMTEPSSIDITPNGDGQFGATSSKLQVATTNSAGYSIYLNTIDKTNAMVNVQQQDTEQINAISTAQHAKDFAANTWGFALARGENEMATGGSGESTNKSNNSASSETLATDLLYHPVPTTSNLITSVSRATETDTYTLTFGANIDTALPAGQYANTVLVSVVANPQTIRSLSELTYMQEMSSLTCENSSLHETKQLIDSRDNQSYWVSKLADGNCWMTQNLALDLNEKTLPLTPETSDVSGEWRPEKVTENGIATTTGNTDPNGVGSWNVGDYVYATPLRGEYCSKQTSGGYMADAAKAGETIDHCQDFPKVTGWKTDFDAGMGIWNGQSLTYVAANAEQKTYDEHYSMGNFYQWNTAVAGSGVALSSPEDSKTNPEVLTNAPSSICPHGWQLPRGGSNLTTGVPYTTNNYWALVESYGYTEKDLAISTSNGFFTSSLLIDRDATDSKNLFRLPLAITAAGWMYTTLGTFRQVGAVDVLWTATAFIDDKSSYVLSASAQSGGIAAGAWFGREAGLSVRCIAH